MQNHSVSDNKVMDRTAAFYSRPSYLGGAGTIFAGARRQRGGSILGALKKIVLPLAQNFGKSFKRNALGLAKDIVEDANKGQHFTDSILSRMKQRTFKTVKQGLTGGPPTAARKKKVIKRLSNQRGRGKKRIVKRRVVTRKKTSRKRRAPTQRASTAKRRRRNF